jgi:hypothetical protein
MTIFMTLLFQVDRTRWQQGEPNHIFLFLLSCHLVFHVILRLIHLNTPPIQGNTKLSPDPQMNDGILVLVQKNRNTKKESYYYTEP